jgi:hypothetical protein
MVFYTTNFIYQRNYHKIDFLQFFDSIFKLLSNPERTLNDRDVWQQSTLLELRLQDIPHGGAHRS